LRFNALEIFSGHDASRGMHIPSLADDATRGNYFKQLI